MEEKEKYPTINLCNITSEEFKEFKKRCKAEGYLIGGLLGKWIKSFIDKSEVYHT